MELKIKIHRLFEIGLSTVFTLCENLCNDKKTNNIIVYNEPIWDK